MTCTLCSRVYFVETRKPGEWDPLGPERNPNGTFKKGSQL